MQDTSFQTHIYKENITLTPLKIIEKMTNGIVKTQQTAVVRMREINRGDEFMLK